MTIATAAYPADREADVVVRDGTLVHIRPVRTEDESAIATFYEDLTLGSRVFRFFSGSTDLRAVAKRAVDVDYRDSLSLVATVGIKPRVIAHALYIAMPDRRAEVAWAIADDWQRRGLGTLLLAHLAEAAEANGIGPFVAYVMVENDQMIDMLRESGLPLRTGRTADGLTFEFPTSLSQAARERFERREQVATAASLAAVLAPRSVAVIGASRSRGTIGGEIFHNLLASGFAGPVYAVNRASPVVQSVAAYRVLADVPGPVDLAVIVVPADEVLVAARECAEKGVRSIVVISAGFGEIGADGLARQRELVTLCRSAGMRLVGPNCLGIMNTAPEVSLNATFAPHFASRGHVALMSQSGALGLSIVDGAIARGIGLSSFVSVGNKADVSANDLLQYWETDDATDVILLYLESFGNPRKFARVSRRVARSKPILAVKSGRTVAGARATSSHTGAVVASSDVTVDALFHQTGVLRMDTLGELLDAATLLTSQPLPTGDRVAVITNAGGPAILCADACEAHGLRVITLDDATQRALRAFLPVEASVGNPVDMIASATAEQYADAITTLAACADVDAIIAVFIPPLVTSLEEVARAIARAATRLPRRIPIATVLMSEERAWSALSDARVPVYPYPEDAARAMAHAAAYAAWRRTPEGNIPQLTDTRPADAARIIARALEDHEGWLDPGDVAELFGCYGLPLVAQHIATTPAAAAAAAEAIGGPVALKAIAPGLVHKTEANAVRLGVAAADVVRESERMRDALGERGIAVGGFVVQPMVSGAEMLVGVVNDASFGPVVACGAGGTLVELLKDVSVRLTPLTDRDAAEMIRSLRTFPLLDGYRGRPRLSTAALEDVLLRVAAMVEAHHEIAELDCNPVVVRESDALIVDARVRVAPASLARPFGALSS